MPRFKNSVMSLEVCDYFTPISKENALCKYYIGNKKYHEERCGYYCSILRSKRMMEEGQVFRRVKGGALRKK